ncbi:MAG: tetratricopeptide repeat protein [Bacteroidota bacterium]
MEKVLQKLSPDTIQLLTCVAPFQVINGLPDFIQDYWDMLQLDISFENYPFYQWENAKLELVAYGLLEEVPDKEFYLRFSPVFSSFLRQYMYKVDPKLWKRITFAFTSYLSTASEIYLGLLQSNKTQNRHAGRVSVEIESGNFLFGLTILKKRKQSILSVLKLLSEFLFIQGELDSRQKLISDAYQLLEAQSKERNRSGILMELAEVQYMLGGSYYGLHEWDTAEKHWEECVQKFSLEDENFHFTLIKADVQRNLGVIYHKKRAFIKAEEAYLLSLELYRQLENEGKQALLYRNLSVLYWELKRYQEAEDFGLKALRIFHQQKNTYEEGQELLNLGSISQALNKYDQAQQQLEISLKIFESFDDLSGVAAVSQNLGTLYQRRGKYDKAKEVYKTALNIFVQQEDEPNQAQVLQNLGTIEEFKGNLQEALEYNHLSLNIFLKFRDAHRAGRTYVSLGSLSGQLNDVSSALTFYQKAIEIFQNEEDSRADLAKVWQSLGGLYLGLDKYKQAESSLYHALNIYKALGDRLEMGGTYMNLAILREKEGNFPDALRLYQLSAEIMREVDRSYDLAVVYQNMGDLYRKMGNLKEAESLFKQAFLLYQNAEDLLSQAQMQHNLGSISAQLGELKKAISSYQKSLNTLLASGNLDQAFYALKGIGGFALYHGLSSLGRDIIIKAFPYFEEERKAILREWLKQF